MLNEPSCALMKVLKETARAGGSRRKPNPPLLQSNGTVDCKRLEMTAGELSAPSVLYN